MRISRIMFFDVERAKKAQNALSKLVIVAPLNIDSIDIVVGLDVSYHGSNAVAAAVAYSVDGKEVVDVELSTTRVRVPYIPGLLAFREAPAMIYALKKLAARLKKIDVIMVNGHGLAHPRKCGIATHIGIVTDMPTIGVAKKLLHGEVVAVEGRLAIVVNSTTVGYVASKGGRQIYVSIGHRVTAEDALRIALNTWEAGSPLPEPIRLADKISRGNKIV
ncbi:MAG: endonuclease V [Ignisphaera sp.]|nr:endonuclease V [Ignisphaera sp.]MCX8167891.1 endonuclease V [Ignisphaera sp.]MDW8085468.1 endonuclease V [Ignisphaera sp.]